jgi:hypothetical protein
MLLTACGSSVGSGRGRAGEHPGIVGHIMKPSSHSTINMPLIDLMYAGGPGLIILCDSGIMYTAQTCGVNCLHPSAEGVYLPLCDELSDLETQLTDFFVDLAGAAHGIDEKDADFIDALLAESYHTRFICVDRERLRDSHEAWLYVRFPRSPARYPDDPGVEYREAWIDPDSPYQQSLALFWGFESTHGILTWNNSD